MEECKYDKIKKYSNGITVVSIIIGDSCMGGKDIKWGLIDSTGNEISSCKYDFFGEFNENVAVVGIGNYNFWGNDCSIGFYGKWGCIDNTGKEFVPIGKYKLVGFNRCCEHPGMVEFCDNILAVCEWKTEKWGFIDNSGNEIIQCKYDSIDWFPRNMSKSRGLFSPPMPFINGFAKVRIGDKWFTIDRMGNEVNN